MNKTKRNICVLAAAFCSLCLSALLALAGDCGYTVIVGQAISIRVSSPEKIFVRNPDLLDVIDVRSDSIEVLGKKTGFTVVEVWGKDKFKRKYEINVLSQDLTSLKDRVKELISENLKIKGVTIKEDTLNSKVILEGWISQQDFDKISKTIEKYSEDITNFIKVKEERDLVQVDVEILELSKQFIDQLGFDWANSVSLSTAAITGKPWEFMRIVDWTRGELSATVYMREKEGNGKILARPKLVCLSGKEASFQVGGEVPVLTYEGGDSAVDYKDYGVKLDISPLIEKEGILLGIKTEISELDSANELDATVFVTDSGSSQFTVPAFTKRIVETQLFMKEGETLFISGLLKDKISEDDIEKVPGLGNIPILGMLFKSKDYQQDQTELVMTLTPRIMRNNSGGELTPVEEEKAGALGAVEKKKPEFPIAEYMKDVQKKINQALVYPVTASQAGWQGALKIGLSINSMGRVLEAKITESSGYKIFDDAALDIARSIEPYASFPADVEAEKLWMEIPVVYSLN